MNYLDFLSPAYQSENIKFINYKLLLQMEIWNKINKSSNVLKELFGTYENKDYLRFLSWILEHNMDYNWTLPCHLIAFLKTINISVNIHHIRSLLSNAAQDWSIEDISENRSICFYLPSENHELFIYNRMNDKQLSPSIQICRCENLINNVAGNCQQYIYISEGISQPDILNSMRRL